MASSSVRMICPNLKCRSILAVPMNARGKTVRGRACGMRVQVPMTLNKPRPVAVEPDPEPANTSEAEA